MYTSVYMHVLGHVYICVYICLIYAWLTMYLPIFDVVYAAVIAELISFTLAAALDALSEISSVPLMDNKTVLSRLKQRLYVRGNKVFCMSRLMKDSVRIASDMKVLWSDNNIGDLVVASTRGALTLEFAAQERAKHVATADTDREEALNRAIQTGYEILGKSARFVKEGEEWVLKEA
eukprot:GHVQ01001409.1.p1 GENE.GHVQ01001409.1~~GHVQ01001409.1.p1  ORF type:complete len:177 (+),score=21.19 GHVQ01001409.1:721-1251(+)